MKTNRKKKGKKEPAREILDRGRKEEEIQTWIVGAGERETVCIETIPVSLQHIGSWSPSNSLASLHQFVVGTETK